MRLRDLGVEAVALYGSVVRNDTDELSDVDVLIVGEWQDGLQRAAGYLSGFGLSCAGYSWEKLRILSARKALFLQHLKNESLILYDPRSQLRSLLGDFEPAVDYTRELDATRRLVLLTERFPDSPQGLGWVLDVLAVALRNLAILSLANEGRYVFSLERLLDQLGDMGRLGTEERVELLQLRYYKTVYRRRRFDLIPTLDRVTSIQAAIGRIFAVDIMPRVVSDEAFVDYCLGKSKAVASEHWYLRLRLCEGVVVAGVSSSREYGDGQLDCLEAIQRVIQNPSCYSTMLSDSARALQNEVESFLERSRLAA